MNGTGLHLSEVGPQIHNFQLTSLSVMCYLLFLRQAVSGSTMDSDGLYRVASETAEPGNVVPKRVNKSKLMEKWKENG